MEHAGRSYFVTIRTGTVGAVADFGTWSLDTGTAVWDHVPLEVWGRDLTEAQILDELYYVVLSLMERRA